MDAAGNFLISWQSQHQDGFSWGIYGREYDASGNTLIGEFPINHRVEGPQTSPAVASNASGQTLVAWLGNSSTHEPSVLAHRYAIPNVEPDFSVGGELSLTTYAGLEEMPPAAAMNAAREAVVAWVSYAEDGSGLGVFAQLLDKYGAPIGDRIAVNSFTAGNQGAPAVARAPDGQFVIVWQSEDQEESGDGYGIYAQRYSATGVPEGLTFLVNTTVAGDQKAPAVAMGTDGRFVIAWESVSDDGSLDIMAQRYLPDGQADGGEFRVNNLTGLDQKDPAIAMNAAGQFVIAWVSDHPALEPEAVDTEKSIFVQWYDSNGQATGDEVLVHKYVKDAQEAPAVGIDGTGRFVVAWQSINQDGNSWGVFARRFLADKTPVERREFVVNETRMGPQRYVGLGMDEYGRFVITWQSNTRAELADGGSGGGGGGQNPNTPEGSSWDLFGRQYGFDGQREGGELPVNQWQMGPQIRPVVAQAAGGDFGIFWIGQGPDHIEGVHGRLYQNLFDLGDAADPAYPTLLSSNGARHLPWSDLYLGSSVDVEVEGQPTADATGDDLDVNGDDEDGVVLPIVMIPGMAATATVTASVAGKLDAWIDFNQNGVFEPAERIASSLDVVAGENAVTLVVPPAALPGTSTARFRISTVGGLAPDGVAVDGEVEDHRVEISAQNSARLVDDPANPGQKVLVVVGSTGKNFLTIAPDAAGNLMVREGKKVKSSTVLGVFSSAEVSRIVAYGLANNDTIRVDSRISTPSELHGNAGKDALYGGAGDDLLYGDEGNDTLNGDSGNDVLVGGLDKDKLTGGHGRDLLIGGAGADGLDGGDDDDILIGGSTTHDSQPSALSAIMAVWRSAAGFLERIASLGGLLNSSTVIGDGIREKVTGGRGRDWMIDFESQDQFKDFDSNPTTGDHQN
ncbi:MAG TPA: GEVED domain-containing protein [Thermomicrobiales bacterium]|nr:GEVED domain-containing protein [Thermomicrobiales bacterium]